MTATTIETLKQKRLDLTHLLDTRVRQLSKELSSTARRINRYADSDRTPDALVATVQNSVLNSIKNLPGLVAVLDDLSKVEQEISAAETQQAWTDAWKEATDAM